MRSPKVPWWPGSIKTGGIHVHHLVFGIVLLMLAGFLGFALQPDSPWLEILAAAFGVGMGLTLDEFALWLHLEDVYWAEQGRRSVDAVIVATLLGGALLLGFTPWDSHDASSVLAAATTVVAVLAISTIAALKGKYTSAVVGSWWRWSAWWRRSAWRNRDLPGRGVAMPRAAASWRGRRRATSAVASDTAAGRIGSAAPRPRSSRRRRLSSASASCQRRASVRWSRGVTHRAPAPTGTPPAAPRPGPPASSASCPPSASPAASACGSRRRHRASRSRPCAAP